MLADLFRARSKSADRNKSAVTPVSRQNWTPHRDWTRGSMGLFLTSELYRGGGGEGPFSRDCAQPPRHSWTEIGLTLKLAITLKASCNWITKEQAYVSYLGLYLRLTCTVDAVAKSRNYKAVSESTL